MSQIDVFTWLDQNNKVAFACTPVGDATVNKLITEGVITYYCVST